MLNDKETIRVSKFLSLVLRHQPQIINLQLDGEGWASVKDLLRKMRLKGFGLDSVALQQVVDTNNKKRFAFNEDGTKVRASQGHSVTVDLGFKESVPPPVLYHGTAEKNLAFIFWEGLQKRMRQHVHLSADAETARQVGQRHGKSVVLKVEAGKMHDDGFAFYLSANGVWLMDSVPAAYLQQD